jgi:HEAT repeat protein
MSGHAATALACAVLVCGIQLAAGSAGPSAQVSRDDVTAEQVQGAIDTLGAFDFPRRTAAARTIRRASPSIAVPALLRAVASHTDEYVRFRALVVLSAFNEPRTLDVMLKALSDRNDRVRAVAYSWFEHNAQPSVLPRLIQALDREESEFVRPALTRALAAYASDAKVREILSGLVMKGHDMFRAVVIEAAGDYKVAHAFKPLNDVAKLDGPLQDDAVLAIGKLGDKRGLETLAGLQRTAPRTHQPTIAAAICLLGSNCPSHQRYITETLQFGIENPGFQDLVRAAASGLAALAMAGNADAAKVLIERGTPARDPERAAIALALGTVALRNTTLLLQVLSEQADHAGAVALLRDAFDMLEEDLEEERFFAFVRRTYWQAAEASATRRIAEALIQGLEF